MAGQSELSLPERVAVLETELGTVKGDLKEIKDKLDDLLTLKARGMGALSLVSLIIGSGVIGLILTIIKFVPKPHL